ncbi:MAG: caspase family protein, partial [Anaerolineales bacterium]
MRTAAVIIGIDEYVNRPLTSAVNDARAFRQALLDLNLTEEPHITMLTTPLGDSQAEATRDNIADLLYEFYDHGESYQRLFFFYAGHGLLAFSDPARSRVRTTLMPSDVQDLQRHGAKLLDLNEIQERFRFSGPEEQFFFVDACRDLDYKAYPDVGNLGWGGGRPLGAARRQANLYAVSELGKAEGAAGGLGRMTAHLLDALRSDVAAVDYDERQAEWVVSMQSLSDYVKWAVSQELANEPLYKLKYMVPQLQEPDPKPSPIRVVDPVGVAWLTIHIEPDEKAAGTQVDISLRGVRLGDSCLPPRQNHEQIPLQPQYYRVDARSGIGSADPERIVVD